MAYLMLRKTAAYPAVLTDNGTHGKKGHLLLTGAPQGPNYKSGACDPC